LSDSNAYFVVSHKSSSEESEMSRLKEIKPSIIEEIINTAKEDDDAHIYTQYRSLCTANPVFAF